MEFTSGNKLVKYLIQFIPMNEAVIIVWLEPHIITVNGQTITVKREDFRRWTVEQGVA